MPEWNGRGLLGGGDINPSTASSCLHTALTSPSKPCPRPRLDVSPIVSGTGAITQGKRETLASISRTSTAHRQPAQVCFLFDAESLASLARILDDPPPLWAARDLEDKRARINAGCDAWVWLMDTRLFPREDPPEESREDSPKDSSGDASEYMYEDWHQDSYRGWLRVALKDNEVSWFDRVVRGRTEQVLVLSAGET